MSSLALGNAKRATRALLSGATALTLLTVTVGQAYAEQTTTTSWKLNHSLSTPSTTSHISNEPPEPAPIAPARLEPDQCPTLQIVVVNGQGDNSLQDADNASANLRLSGMVNAGIQAGNEGDNNTIASTYIGWKGANRDQQSLGSTNRPTLTGEESSTRTGGVGNVSSDKLMSNTQAEELSAKDTENVLRIIAKKCPGARFFLLGEAEGAGSAHRVLVDIGQGNGPIPADKVAGGALYSDPYRSPGQSTFANPAQTRPTLPKGKDSDQYQKMLGEYTMPAAPGAGVKTFAQSNPSLATFGALADKIGTFCLPMDLVCSMVQKSPIGQIFTNIKGTSTTFQQDPMMAIRDLSSSFLGTSIRTANDFITNDIDFDWDKGQFVINKNTDTVLSRAVGYSTQGRLTEDDLSPIVGSLAKVGGMALGASVTVAKKMLSPAALMGYAAAGIGGTVSGSTAGGTAGGALGAAVGGAIGAWPAEVLGPLGAVLGGVIGGAVGGTASLAGAVGTKTVATAIGLVPPTTLAAGAQKVFQEVSALGLPADILGSAATQSQLNQETQATGYRTTPVAENGANPLTLGSQWIASLGKMFSGVSASDALSSGSLFSSLLKGGSISATLAGGSGVAGDLLGSAVPLLDNAGKAVIGAAGPVLESVIPAATSLAGEVIPSAMSIVAGIL